mmetsp:Transcript_9592/g.15963  ORF Transcript_9592/g.15963 Transcript_9592/m.15963 type:complete len:364 (-) Transcript_9592:217-1308(-)
MEHFHAGNIQFIDEDYEDAIASYTSALTNLPNNADVLLNRATAYLKIRKLYESLEDLNACLGIAPKKEIAWYRKGVVFFEMEEFESAKSAFSQGLKLRQEDEKSIRDTAPYARFIRKCNAEIADEEVTIAPPVLKTATSTAPVAAASIGTTTATSSSSTGSSSSTNRTVAAPAPIRYQYYQSATSLSISVLAKNLAKEDVLVDIQSNALKVVVKHREAVGSEAGVGAVREEVVIDKELYNTIYVEKSKFNIYKTKIEITLTKLAAENWPGIERVAGGPVPLPPAAAAAAATATGAVAGATADSMSSGGATGSSSSSSSSSNQALVLSTTADESQLTTDSGLLSQASAGTRKRSASFAELPDNA